MTLFFPRIGYDNGIFVKYKESASGYLTSTLGNCFLLIIPEA